MNRSRIELFWYNETFDMYTVPLKKAKDIHRYEKNHLFN